MNGHLQLSISLKNDEEIKNGITLLLNLLPREKRIGMLFRDFDSLEFKKEQAPQTSLYAVATKGDLVKLSTTKPKMLSNDKIVENLMRGAPKAPPVPKYDRVYRDADGKVKVHKGRDRTMREKFRQNALKRKRDKSGHFLPTKK